MNILLLWFLLKGICCFEKMGWMEELSSSVESWGYRHLEQESAPEFSVDDIRLRAFVLREGRMPRRNTKDSENNSLDFEEENKLFKKRLPIEEQQLFTGHRRLVEEILESYDPTGFFLNKRGSFSFQLPKKSARFVRKFGYFFIRGFASGMGQDEKKSGHVHPRRDFRESTRVNLSMSLYQILEVDERKQSIVVNVWMVCGGRPVTRIFFRGGGGGERGKIFFAPNFWRRRRQKFLFSAPQAKILRILEGRRPKKFTFSAPQAPKI
ncbi:unnamed protein product [Meloidogyne enterolobii]|uniref:Uncharacterized protein n=1 Tax=Meloidogyne enterolobii TaxID=390850 RepID=A0ACB0ZE59_MELEN